MGYAYAAKGAPDPEPSQGWGGPRPPSRVNAVDALRAYIPGGEVHPGTGFTLEVQVERNGEPVSIYDGQVAVVTAQDENGAPVLIGNNPTSMRGQVTFRVSNYQVLQHGFREDLYLDLDGEDENMRVRISVAIIGAALAGTVGAVVVNSAPVAAASGSPLSGPKPLTVNFSSEGSSDPDGGELAYDWDFGDGGIHSEEASPSHAYATEGNYSARLTVAEPHGKTATSTPVAVAVAASPWVQDADLYALLGVTNIVDWCEHAGTLYCTVQVGAAYKVIYRVAAGDWRLLSTFPAASPSLTPTMMVSFGGELFVCGNDSGNLRCYRWNGASWATEVTLSWPASSDPHLVVLGGSLMIVTQSSYMDAYVAERTGAGVWTQQRLAGVTPIYGTIYRSATFDRGFCANVGLFAKTGLATIAVTPIAGTPTGYNSAELDGKIFIGAGVSGIKYKGTIAGGWTTISGVSCNTLVEGDGFLVLAAGGNLVKFTFPGTFETEEAGFGTVWNNGLACDGSNIYAFRNDRKVWRRLKS